MIETISRTGYAFLRYLATRLLRIDLMLLALVVTLTTIGFIALFSAGYSFPWRIEGQIRNIAVAGVVMLVVSCIPVKAFQKATVPIFIVMSILANYVFFGAMHIPMDCGFWALNLTSALLVIATQALAVFLFSLFPALSIIISIVSMVGSLGATLGGVTFPVLHMFAPVYYASYLFPVRHFVEIGQNLLYGNYGYAYMWGNVACLLLFLIPPLLLLPHLKRSLISRKYDDIE